MATHGSPLRTRGTLGQQLVPAADVALLLVSVGANAVAAGPAYAFGGARQAQSEVPPPTEDAVATPSQPSVSIVVSQLHSNGSRELTVEDETATRSAGVVAVHHTPFTSQPLTLWHDGVRSPLEEAGFLVVSSDSGVTSEPATGSDGAASFPQTATLDHSPTVDQTTPFDASAPGGPDGSTESSERTAEDALVAAGATACSASQPTRDHEAILTVTDDGTAFETAIATGGGSSPPTVAAVASPAGLTIDNAAVSDATDTAGFVRFEWTVAGEVVPSSETVCPASHTAGEGSLSGTTADGVHSLTRTASVADDTDRQTANFASDLPAACGVRDAPVGCRRVGPTAPSPRGCRSTRQLAPPARERATGSRLLANTRLPCQPTTRMLVERPYGRPRPSNAPLGAPLPTRPSGSLSCPPPLPPIPTVQPPVLRGCPTARPCNVP